MSFYKFEGKKLLKLAHQDTLIAMLSYQLMMTQQLVF